MAPKPVRVGRQTRLHTEKVFVDWKSSSSPPHISVLHKYFEPHLSQTLKVNDTIEIRIQVPGKEAGGLDRRPLYSRYTLLDERGEDGHLKARIDMTKVHDYVLNTKAYKVEIVAGDELEVWSSDLRDWFVLVLVTPRCAVCREETSSCGHEILRCEVCKGCCHRNCADHTRGRYVCDRCQSQYGQRQQKQLTGEWQGDTLQDKGEEQQQQQEVSHPSQQRTDRQQEPSLLEQLGPPGQRQRRSVSKQYITRQEKRPVRRSKEQLSQQEEVSPQPRLRRGGSVQQQQQQRMLQQTSVQEHQEAGTPEEEDSDMQPLANLAERCAHSLAQVWLDRLALAEDEDNGRGRGSRRAGLGTTTMDENAGKTAGRQPKRRRGVRSSTAPLDSTDGCESESRHDEGAGPRMPLLAPKPFVHHDVTKSAKKPRTQGITRATRRPEDHTDGTTAHDASAVEVEAEVEVQAADVTMQAIDLPCSWMAQQQSQQQQQGPDASDGEGAGKGGGGGEGSGRHVSEIEGIDLSELNNDRSIGGRGAGAGSPASKGDGSPAMSLTQDTSSGSHGDHDLHDCALVRFNKPGGSLPALAPLVDDSPGTAVATQPTATRLEPTATDVVPADKDGGSTHIGAAGRARQGGSETMVANGTATADTAVPAAAGGREVETAPPSAQLTVEVNTYANGGSAASAGGSEVNFPRLGGKGVALRRRGGAAAPGLAGSGPNTRVEPSAPSSDGKQLPGASGAQGGPSGPPLGALPLGCAASQPTSNARSGGGGGGTAAPAAALRSCGLAAGEGPASRQAATAGGGGGRNDDRVNLIDCGGGSGSDRRTVAEDPDPDPDPYLAALLQEFPVPHYSSTVAPSLSVEAAQQLLTEHLQAPDLQSTTDESLRTAYTEIRLMFERGCEADSLALKLRQASLSWQKLVKLYASQKARLGGRCSEMMQQQENQTRQLERLRIQLTRQAERLQTQDGELKALRAATATAVQARIQSQEEEARQRHLVLELQQQLQQAGSEKAALQARTAAAEEELVGIRSQLAEVRGELLQVEDTLRQQQQQELRKQVENLHRRHEEELQQVEEDRRRLQEQLQELTEQQQQGLAARVEEEMQLRLQQELDEARQELAILRSRLAAAVALQGGGQGAAGAGAGPSGIGPNPHDAQQHASAAPGRELWTETAGAMEYVERLEATIARLREDLDREMAGRRADLDREMMGRREDRKALEAEAEMWRKMARRNIAGTGLPDYPPYQANVQLHQAQYRAVSVPSLEPDDPPGGLHGWGQSQRGRISRFAAMGMAAADTSVGPGLDRGMGSGSQLY